MGIPVNPNCVCNTPPSPITSWQIHEETMETDPNYILCNKVVVYSMNSFLELQAFLASDLTPGGSHGNLPLIDGQSETQVTSWTCVWCLKWEKSYGNAS